MNPTSTTGIQGQSSDSPRRLSSSNASSIRNSNPIPLSILTDDDDSDAHESYVSPLPLVRTRSNAKCIPSTPSTSALLMSSSPELAEWATTHDHRQVAKRSYMQTLGGSDSTDEKDNRVTSDGKEGANATRKPGPCVRCKNLKFKCEFKTSSIACRRCLSRREECIIAGPSPRQAPHVQKRVHLLTHLRQQATQIEDLKAQPEETETTTGIQPIQNNFDASEQLFSTHHSLSGPGVSIRGTDFNSSYKNTSRVLTFPLSVQDTPTQPSSLGFHSPSLHPHLERALLPTISNGKNSRRPRNEIPEGLMGEESQDHLPLASVSKETTNATRKRGCCSRCKTLKIRCEFVGSSSTICKRCLNGGHECVAAESRKCQTVPKHEHLNKIREQQAIEIEALTAKLGKSGTHHTPKKPDDDDCQENEQLENGMAPSLKREEDAQMKDFMEQAEMAGACQRRPSQTSPQITSNSLTPSIIQSALSSLSIADTNTAKEKLLDPPPHSQTTIQTPDLAYSHACIKEAEIRAALGELQYEGSYLIQVGFNEEMLHLGQVMEEIYIFLDSPVVFSEEYASSKLEEPLSPFPGIVYTPDATYIVPTSSPELQNWQDRRANYHFMSASTGLGGHGEGGSVGGNGQKGGSGGKGGGPVGNRGIGSGFGPGSEGNAGQERKGDGAEGSGGGGGGGGGNGNGNGNGDSDSGTRSIHIPFGSSLYDDEHNGRTTFAISSGVDIKIEENRQHRTPPPDSEWPGPWIGVKMNRLEAAASGVYLHESTYALGLSQVRITGTSDQPIDVVHSSPSITHLEEDNAKRKKERNVTAGGWGTIGATNPNLRIGGTFSRTSGLEQTQRKWAIMTHQINSKGVGPRREAGMFWKYGHNDTHFQREPAHCFESKPSMILGVGHRSHLRPSLEVEVVMHWSLMPLKPRHVFAPFLKGIRQKGPPAFANFFHHVSIAVDLRELEQRHAWVVGAVSRDKQSLHPPTSTPQTPAEPVYFDPIPVDVFTETSLCNCKIFLRRAIHGRISSLSHEERTGTGLLVPSFSSGDNVLSLVPPPSWGQLPTPLPSPQLAPTQPTNGDSDSEMSDVVMDES